MFRDSNSYAIAKEFLTWCVESYWSYSPVSIAVHWAMELLIWLTVGRKIKCPVKNGKVDICFVNSLVYWKFDSFFCNFDRFVRVLSSFQSRAALTILRD